MVQQSVQDDKFGYFFSALGNFFKSHLSQKNLILLDILKSFFTTLHKLCITVQSNKTSTCLITTSLLSLPNDVTT